jgi:hypothetical protein
MLSDKQRIEHLEKRVANLERFVELVEKKRSGSFVFIEELWKAVFGARQNT